MTADAQRGTRGADDLRGDLGFGGAGPENFVPWEQIEPLIAAGYDDAEKLGREILKRAGLPARGYRLGLIGAPPFHEAIRRGVYINKIGPDNWWQNGPSDTAPCNPDAE